IKNCDIVFIAVPTPTVCGVYDDSIIREVIPLVEKNKIIVLKSTICFGLSRVLQKKFKDYTIVHSPEFLSETTASEDTRNPFFNIVGINQKSKKHKDVARLIHSILPKAPASFTVSYEEAELIKYAHNTSAYTRIVFSNLLYDLSKKVGADWKNVVQAIKADPFIATKHVSNNYIDPVHKGGRGAGGNCFIKDFAIFSNMYKKIANDPLGAQLLQSFERKNIELLQKSKKDLKLLNGVYCNLKKPKRKKS
ncbi:MAG: hypothetical protein COU27_01290, partial [Candidatus Levybacteria bacterium CG10_big_fil_rev_8_21_14_0_10_36_7]